MSVGFEYAEVDAIRIRLLLLPTFHGFSGFQTRNLNKYKSSTCASSSLFVILDGAGASEKEAERPVAPRSLVMAPSSRADGSRQIGSRSHRSPFVTKSKTYPLSFCVTEYRFGLTADMGQGIPPGSPRVSLGPPFRIYARILRNMSVHIWSYSFGLL
eukprot:855805-Amorphochlora_amoeboformis.AAC.1